MAGKTQHIAIVGAGLVGPLLSIYLARRGHQVSVFDRRPDLRKKNAEAGRSINLALSNRGLRALEEVGLAAEVKDAAIPMHGRMMHDLEGNLTFQPYGREGQFINSISRTELNIVLINAAEKAGVKFLFEHKCLDVDLAKTEITFQPPKPQHPNTTAHQRPNTSTQSFDLIVGADGAYSVVREAMRVTDRFDFAQDYIEHGYKEFHIPGKAGGKSPLGKNALHIWPRESFMMIALPNPDGSLTGTLFFPWEGNQSFQSLVSDEAIRSFFRKTFPDLIDLMPHYAQDFQSRSASSLVTVKCWPWVRNNTFLIGDAAHAIVPFYGQGMNAGFEDCRILNQILDKQPGSWPLALEEFQRVRKPDADAIAELAIDNFVEMRDSVADPDFLLRKKIEATLHELYPDRWIPLYSMVTFYDHIRYSEARLAGQRQGEIMDKVMKKPELAAHWKSLNLEELVNQL